MAITLDEQRSIIRSGVAPWRKHMDQVKENHSQRQRAIEGKHYEGLMGSVVYVYDQGKNRLAKAADWGGASIINIGDELSHWSAKNLTYPKAFFQAGVSGAFGDMNVHLKKNLGEQKLDMAYQSMSKAYGFYTSSIYGNMTQYQKALFQPIFESVLIGKATARILGSSVSPALVVTSNDLKTSIVFKIDKPIGNIRAPLALEYKPYVIDQSKIYKTAQELRKTPGVVQGTNNFIKVQEGDIWLKGKHANAGAIPAQIAEKMVGMEFKSFDDFRKSFWKNVAADVNLSKGFNTKDLIDMQKGMAPLVQHPGQQVGKLAKYNLHHKKPISSGGEVYNLDNIIIVTPQYHSQFHTKKVKQKSK
jgi:hypothetical protein